jgi:hypothetical protein
VNERRDDTTKPGAESPRAPGSYYYDDATGYERFDPEEDEEGVGREGPSEDDGRTVPPPSAAPPAPFKRPTLNAAGL